MVTGDAATPPSGEHTAATPTGPEDDEAPLSTSRVERVAGGLGRGEWVKIIAVIVAGLALTAALLFVMPALQVKAGDYRCPLPLPTPTSGTDVSSLSTSCRAPGASNDTINQQAVDAARTAARAPYGVLAAALLGGAAAIVGVIVNSHNARLTRDTINTALDANDATRIRDAITADLTRAGQYTDRYIKAIQLINDDKLNARLGGLYALEQLAKEAPLTYHATIVDVLSAYIRDRAPWPPLTPTTELTAPQPRSERRVANGHREPATTPQEQQIKRPALDIQTALTILGRRSPTHTTPNGQSHDLEDHFLDLSRTYLEGAKLPGAHLKGANLPGAHLKGAWLVGAHLDGAVLSGAHLENTVLFAAHLKGAALNGARLEGAVLVEARLEGAVLFGAHMKDADLSEAHLEGADLRGTDLSQKQLAGAVVDDETQLPEHLKR